MDQKKNKQTPPFEPSKKPAQGGAVAGKHGMAYSRVRHLARMAMNKAAKEKKEMSEVSDTTLASYVSKAKKSADELDAQKKFGKSLKRRTGILSAVSKQVGRAGEKLGATARMYKEEAKATYCGRCGTTHVPPSQGGTCPALKKEETNMDEMSQSQMKKREDVVKSMKKNFADFRKRYGEKAKSVMYATATKQAMKEEEIQELQAETPEGQHLCAKHVYSELFGEGVVLDAQHAEPDAEGKIDWYMVEFADGIRKVQTDDIEIMVAEYHMNHKKKMKKEELVGNQHKIDANKNNKIDAHDFKLLRQKKNRM